MADTIVSVRCLREVQSDHVNLSVLLQETCHLMAEIDKSWCSGASWSKCKMVREWLEYSEHESVWSNWHWLQMKCGGTEMAAVSKTLISHWGLLSAHQRSTVDWLVTDWCLAFLVYNPDSMCRKILCLCITLDSMWSWNLREAVTPVLLGLHVSRLVMWSCCRVAVSQWGTWKRCNLAWDWENVSQLVT